MFYLSKNPEKISEGSCDTEDWSKDAENSDLHHWNKLYFKNTFKWKRVIWNCNNIPLFLLYFQSNKYSVSFQKHLKNVTDLKICNAKVHVCT